MLNIIAGPLLAVHTVIVQVRHEWVASPSEIQTMGEPNDFISKLQIKSDKLKISTLNIFAY